MLTKRNNRHYTLEEKNEAVKFYLEGIRLVKKSLAYLTKTGHIWLIPQLIWQSGMKYAGYFLGKRYKKLPRKVVLACTMSPYYWNRNEK